MSLKNIIDIRQEVLTLTVIYQGKKIKIDLGKELHLSNKSLTSSLKEQPSNYAFIGMLHKDYLAQLQAAEVDYKRCYSREYMKAQGQDNPHTGRKYSNDACNELTINNKKVKLKEDRVLALKAICQKLEVALRAFEQKKDVMQTLSANTRKEREM